MSSPTTQDSLRVTLLGCFDVRVGAHRVAEPDWQRRDAQRLFKLLALSPRQRLHREALMELFWPGASPARSANNLAKLVHGVRRVLEPGLKSGGASCYLHRVGEHIALQVPDEDSIDVRLFEREAERALNSAEISSLEHAIGLYTGELLPDDRLDSLFDAHRSASSALFCKLLERCERCRAEMGDTARCIELLDKLIALDPGDERYHRRLMRLYASNAQLPRALLQYRRCVEGVNEIYGTEPDEKTRALFEQIRNDRPAPSVAPIGPSANSASGSDMPTIAVMPFRNAVDDGALDYLCEGITEQLIVRLARNPDRRVLARSTVFRYQDQNPDPRSLRQELHVDSAVMGRLSAHNGMLKITVEHVNTRDGALLWAELYELSIDDVVMLQSTVCREVEAELSRFAGNTTANDTERSETQNSAAYHEYLKGRYYWNKRTHTALRQAVQHFRQAIECDPLFALAYSGLADCFSLLPLYGADAPRETMPKARAAARNALQIDATLAEAHASVGYYLLSYDWNFPASENSFASALELNDRYPTAHQWYHKLLVATGRYDEARTHIAIARKLDPLSSMIATEEAWGMYHAERTAEALSAVNAVVIDTPDFALAHYVRGLAALALGQLSAATDAFDLAVSLQAPTNPFILAMGAQGHARALSGDTAGAQRVSDQLQALAGSRAASAYAQGLIDIALGRGDVALDLLHQAFDERYDRMIFIDREPMLAPLREHAGYHRLRDRLSERPAA